MAEKTVSELAETNSEAAAAEEMDLETSEPAPDAEATNGEAEANSKRARDEEGSEGNDAVAKKTKVEKSPEEERLAKLGEGEGGDKESDRVSLGPKLFGSSIEMFDYFYKLLHYWTTDLDINKYEHLVLLDLIKKGHAEPDKKIGGGIQAFQVRIHPLYKSRCFFLLREDGNADDFSFRKCVDHILPLPENMKANADANKALGGKGGRGGRGGWRGGRGGRGKPRN